MVIRDKQELKRCVKQTVRRALVTETSFEFDVQHGNYGVSELLQTWTAPSGAPSDAIRRACENQTPFCEGVRTMYAALSALDLPAHNLNNAETIVQSYERNAYLREVLDAMRTRRVLVKIKPSDAAESFFEDDRFAAMLDVQAREYFVPGRYGVAYADAAVGIAQLLQACSARDLCSDAELNAIRYCLIPLSEDTGCVLHLHAQDKDTVGDLCDLLLSHPKARAVVTADAESERCLIHNAQQVPNLLVRIGCLDNIREALEQLGTRFIPFAACARLPEQMLGRWENAREIIWQQLFEVYLPLARAGYELTGDAVAQDVEQLFGGNLALFYQKM